MTRKTIAELETQLEKMGNELNKERKANNDLKAHLAQIDAQRPGPTEEDLREHREALAARDEKIETLRSALKNAENVSDSLRNELEEFKNMQGVSDAMEGGNPLKLVPVLGLSGAMPKPKRSGDLMTLGMDVDGGGVLMVVTSGEQMSLNYIPMLKLAKKAAGHVLQKRPEFR